MSERGSLNSGLLCLVHPDICSINDVLPCTYPKCMSHKKTVAVALGNNAPVSRVHFVDMQDP